MTNTDKIRNWILERKEAEEIRPGDKLPCYKKFMMPRRNVSHEV